MSRCLSSRRRLLKTEGFLLVEVALTVAILAVGIVFVLQAFQSSLQAGRRAELLTRAIWLAQGRFAELSLQAKEPPDELTEKSGDFPEGDSAFRWRIVAEEVEGIPSLKQVTLTISSKRSDGQCQEELTAIQELSISQ